jgi:large subunit ribosomal protein L5
MISELQKQYNEKIVPALKDKFGYKNVMQVPRVEKVVLNVGYGKHTKDKSYIENVGKTLAVISGQKPVHNKARKSISNFKIRAGMPIGVSVTLRGNSMYDFLYKFINLTLPRVRDFRGLNRKAVDSQGNYSVGIAEQLAFPEITAEMSDFVHGLEVVVKTSSKTPEEGTALLEALGFPFKK